MTPDQKPPTYEDVARTLDAFFDKWPWGFLDLELASVLKAAYGEQLRDSRRWYLIQKYLKDRLRAKPPNKLFVSPDWKQIFYALLGVCGGKGDNTVPNWAQPACRNYGRRLTLMFYGRKPEHIWARILFECKLAAPSIKTIPKSAGIRILQCFTKPNEELIFKTIMTRIGIVTQYYVCPLRQFEALSTFGLVKIEPHFLYKDIAHSKFRLSDVAVGSFSQMEKLEHTDQFLTNCPIWRSMFRQIRDARSRAERTRCRLSS